MLQRHWAAPDLTPVWSYRAAPAPDGSLLGDPCDTAALAERCAPIKLVLGLAGVVPGRGALDLNIDLGLAALEIASAAGAQHVFLSSSAAVYGAAGTALSEDTPLHPPGAYGAAKAAMEQAASQRAAELGLSVTHLRIGNVAGADALLEQSGQTRALVRFPDGQGPRRSYISAQVLTQVLETLARMAAQGRALPEVINIAQPPALGMAEICAAAGFEVTWQPAPPTALPCVELDVTRLQTLMPVPQASAETLVADWRADKRTS